MHSVDADASGPIFLQARRGGGSSGRRGSDASASLAYSSSSSGLLATNTAAAAATAVERDAGKGRAPLTVPQVAITSPVEMGEVVSSDEGEYFGSASASGSSRSSNNSS